jgi:hypothetical protein
MLLIRREARTSLIAFACACAAHAGAVAWMSKVDRTAAVERVAQRVDAAPTIVRLPPEQDAVGEEKGEGESIASADLPDVARSQDPREIEQAWTRQQPLLSPPPMSETAMPSPPADATPLGPALPEPMAMTASKPREVSPEGTVAAARDPMPPEQPDETPPQERPAEDAAADSAKPQAAQPEVAPPVAAVPPSPPPDPGDAGPSDLDAFAKAEGVDFNRGGIQARTGRPVKLVRPRIDLGFMADVTTFGGRKSTILLRIETDAQGKPSRVEVVKSSGSKQIDDAIRLAMFSSWFGGKMPDAFPFGITLWN